MAVSSTQQEVGLMHQMHGRALTRRNGRPFGSHVPYIVGED
jgi:hypothetical protein